MDAHRFNRDLARGIRFVIALAIAFGAIVGIVAWAVVSLVVSL